MTEKIWLGVDPGKTGGIAWINEDGSLYKSFHTPENINQMSDLVNEIKLEKTIVKATIEDIPVMAFVAKTSFGKLKMNEGQWHGIMSALKIPLFLVKPNKWQVSFFGVKKKGAVRDTKKLSRETASRMFPNESFTKKKDDGRSDAILIAKYGKDYL